MSYRRLSGIAASAALLLGVAGLLAGCRPANTTEEVSPVKTTETSVTIPTNSPQLSALTIVPANPASAPSLPLAGRLIWDEDVTVRIFTPFAGIVRKLMADVGQAVTNDMPLAEIQSGDFAQAQADARKAESEERRARLALARLRDLYEHGAAPLKDLEGAEADEADAQAERERAQHRLAIYGATATAENHGFLLPSPLSGTLVERNVTPGQEVRPDQMLANMPQFTAPLFVVTDPSRLWIQIDATEADLPCLRPGTEFTFASRAFPGQTFTGRVATVSAFLDSTTRTIRVRGTVDNAQHPLKAEMFVSVNLTGEVKGGVSVPSKAVFLSGEKHYLFVESQPGQFERQEVRVGAEQGGQVVILAGVTSGQRVVTDGCILLQQSLK